MSFVILAWNCKKFFIILSPGHLGEDGPIQENNSKVGKITNINSVFMMVDSLENAKWYWRCCQLTWLSIPFNVNSHVNPIYAMKARKREVDLGAAAEGPWGEVGGARPDLPSTGDLKLQLPLKKKIRTFSSHVSVCQTLKSLVLDELEGRRDSTPFEGDQGRSVVVAIV